MSYPVTTAYPTIINQSGTGLNGGKVYIGTAGQDPETNPITVYWDAALTNPAAQPLTTIGGYIWNAGTPAQAYVSPATYSMRVRDRNNQEVFYASNATGPVTQAILSALASTTAPSGASLIGNLGGGTVQDAIFVHGPSSAVASTTARIDWKREPEGTSYPVASVAGSLWTDKVSYSHAISADFNTVNAPVNSPLASPAATLLLVSQNTGSDAIVLPLQTIGGVHVSGKEATAGNFIVYSAAGLTNVKMKGIEIDYQPGAGTTVSEGFGLAINAFTSQCPGSAIYIEGIFGGSWGTGISMGNLSSIGAGLGPAVGNPSMGSLLDSGTAQYQIAAIKLSNTHKLMLFGSAGTTATSAQIYVDSGNNLHAVLPTQKWVFRNNGDTTSLVSVDNSGNIDLENGGVLKVSTTQVLGSRKTGWTAATGTATRSTFATGSVTLPVLAEHVKALIDDFISHGAIGA